MTETIGYTIGENKTTKIEFISKGNPEIGEYIYYKYEGKVIIGMIESLYRGNQSIDKLIRNPEVVKRIMEIEQDMDQYIRGTVTVLGDKDNLIIPRIPCPAGTEIKKADTKLLNEIFERDEGVEIGSILTNPDVKVNLDVNSMVSRHLGILAMTGAGKSNTTAVIIDELLKVGGCIVVMDMHSEYGQSKFSNGKIKTINPRINPKDLNIYELKKLSGISDNAVNQERYLRDAYKYTIDILKDGRVNDFIQTMIDYIDGKRSKLEEEKNKAKLIEACTSVMLKLDDLRKKYAKILNSTDASDIVNEIEPNRVNIVGLSSLDEIASDIIVNHTLDKILSLRKVDEIKFPVFCIIEEAHMLASRERDTRSKYTIAKIAREGRKFGVGLCLVSQSPKSLDDHALSQMNNLIILRTVSPSDQNYIAQCSESISQDLIEQLPSLNVGEAIVLGQMIKVPTMIKVKKFEGKIVGTDLDIIKLWKNHKIQEDMETEQQRREIDDIGI